MTTFSDAFAALRRERADDVVGFVALQREHRDLERIEDLADALHAAIEVGLELLGQLFARRLVGRICLVAKRQPGVVDPAEVLRAVVREEPLEKVDDAPRGRCVLALAGRERTRDEREERPVDQRVAVDQEESRGWRRRYVGHERR